MGASVDGTGVGVISCRTAAVDETQALGGAVAGLAEAGDVIVLVGDLGAGKTAFVQGFTAALGVAAAVTSPTFTLANRYEGRLVVNHFDVYRFEHAEEVRDLALDEFIDEGVTLVEWGDMILHLLPTEHLAVTIGFSSGAVGGGVGGGVGVGAGDGGGGADVIGVHSHFGDQERSVELEARGGVWQKRSSQLRAALAPWVLE